MADADEQVEEPSMVDENETEVAILPVVGVGVCAASLSSLETLFAGFGMALNAAYLVAVRQREGLDVGTVIDMLKRVSPFPVSIAKHGEAIRSNHIYVGGPDDMIGIEDGHFNVQPTDAPIGQRGTIDTMLISLAEHAHDRAVAVLLGGLGSDGTAGVTATKKFGGLSIAEAHTRDDDNGTQGVAGPFGVVDLHLPIDRIAAETARYLGNLTPNARALEGEVPAEEIEAYVGEITTILRKVVGHDFHSYKRGTFLRRVHRRMQVLQIDTLNAYVERLRDDRQEVQDLFQDLLIGVTQFFRDPQEFELLERELPRLFAGKITDDQFRVWVLGCATGEEAYSIAILLREHLATLDQPPRVQIFATDLDARALGLARAGRYATSIENHVRPDRLARWFVREGETYCVSKELREMCIFSPHNVIKDAPFSRVDILSCRNLLIYLNTELQSRVIPIFHFSLVSGGVLFLGNSENITRHQKLFAPVDRKNRVFRRLETATRVIPDFPLSQRMRAVEPLQALAPASPLRLSGTLGRQAEAIAERYAPAYVVVDTQGDVLHFSGRTGRYLEPVAGVASLNVINLVHRDLRVDLRSALHRAISEARRIELPRLALQHDDRTTGVNVIVEPMGANDVTSVVILFHDTGPIVDGAGGDRLEDSEHVERLEAELRLTRDRLQATIEELESTNEELKSSNEEYQSINEELQSANEEMETSKEELQSVNEELQTVNGELGHRVLELGRSNSDLKNLLEATQIATLFLDNDLRVRSFTPSATEIFHLLDTDVERPLGHVVSRVGYPELQDDVRRVLKTLVPVERTVVDPHNQRHFAAKVLPYRSVDNYISGTVVTFTDLTAVREAETALRESEERQAFLLTLADVLRPLADPIEITSEATRVVGRHLKAGRAAYAEVETDGAHLTIHRDYTDDMPSLAGRCSLEDYWTAEMWSDLHAGVTISVADVGQDPLLSEAQQAAYAVAKIRAAIAVPLVNGGRLAAVFSLHFSEPREWHPREMVLVEETAARTWAAVERARGEEALRESEANLTRELANTQQLQEVSSLLIEGENDQALYERILDAAMAIMRSNCATLQIFEPETKELRLLGHRNLHPDTAKAWGRISAEHGTLCGRALREGGRVFSADARRDEPEASEHYRLSGIVSVQSTPLFSRNGGLIGMISTHWGTAFITNEQDYRSFDVLVRQTADAFERARTEAAMRDGEERQRALIEGVPQLVWRASDPGIWTWASPQWTEFTGQSAGESRGWGWLERLHPEDRETARAAWSHALDDGRFDAEYRIYAHESGDYHWFQSRATPIRDGSYRIIEWLGTSTDVDDLRGLQGRQHVLVAELQHRTRNLIGVVRSMADKTARASIDLPDFRNRFRERLEALSRVQGLLSRLNDHDRVTFDELIETELAAMGNGTDRVRLEGPKGVRLRSSMVQTLAMALHELATNAVKYGALGQASGQLAVTWRLMPDEGTAKLRLHIDWRESGVQMPPAELKPSGGGQGRELIEKALPYQLSAKTNYRLGPDGVHCTISIPISTTLEQGADHV